MALKIRHRVVLISAVVLFLGIGANTLVNSIVFMRDYSKALQSKAFVIARTLRSQLDRLLRLKIPLEDLVGFDEQCRELVERHREISYAMVVDLDGRVLFHNDPSQQGLTVSDPAAVRETGNSGETFRTAYVNGEKCYDFTLPVYDAGGEHVGAIRIGLPVRFVSQKVGRMVMYSVLIAGLSLTAGMVSLVVLLKLSVTRPLDRLLTAIDEIRRKGIASSRLIDIDADDEIGQLAAAFNSMTEELKEAQDALIRKEKLAVLGQIAGSVGHELRNPLGVISNAVYYLKATLPDADETTRDYLDIIKDEVANSERIVSDLLNFARTRRPKPGPVDVRDLLQEGLKRCTIPEGVALEQELPEGLPPVWVDRAQIVQVVENLFRNAVDAMPAGGSIRIEAETAGETVKLRITDTGEGIGPDEMERLFQPLYTTKTKGLGLGLTIVKNLTEANGGRIEVESTPGKGTAFTLWLPRGGTTP